MDNYIKNIIEETFKSKAQQRFFYAKAGDKSSPKKERKKWEKMAGEFSSDTNYKKIPEKVESEVSEIVDDNGNIGRKKIPDTKASKGASKKTTDQVVATSMGQMGTHGVIGVGSHSSTIKYWAESDMSKALGFEKTLGQDKDMEDAEDYFQDELGMDEPESEERLKTYGYDPKLPDDKVRLIENPKKYIQDYVETVMDKKSPVDDLVKKDQNEDIDSELNPIIKRQVDSLKKTMEKNNVSVQQVVKILKNKGDE
jgi:hypothetical protein